MRKRDIMAANSVLDDFHDTTVRDVAFRTFQKDIAYFKAHGMTMEQIAATLADALRETV
jgi:hypothetical protein